MIILGSCQVKNKIAASDLISNHVPVVNGFTVKLPPNNSYKETEVLSFALTHPFDVIVTGTPRLALTIGASSVFANYVSGSGSKVLTFTYTIAALNIDTDGISVSPTLDLNGGTIQFGLTNVLLNLTVPSASGIKVNNIGPTVLNITGPLDGTYIEGTNLDFTVTYSKPVVISGIPQLALDIGGATKYATYVSGSGTASVLYRYSNELGLNDKNGVQVRFHILNSGTISDVVGNAATLTISTYTFATVLVDSQGPQILSITPPASGVKVSGNTLSFIANFDETVTVTGVPSLSLDIGGVTLPASYASGSGTTALTFTTAALDGTHFDPGGISYLAGTLSLNAGTLKDILNHAATLTFTAGDISSIKVIYSEVLSWLDLSTSSVANGGTILNLTDNSPAGNNATASSGTVTKISSDAGLNNKASADYDGFSSFVMGALSVKTIVVAFRASTAPVNSKLVASATLGIVLVNQVDMNFGANARFAINAGVLAGGVTSSCVTCYDSGTTKVVTVHFNANQNITALLGDAFDGRIAEIWILNGAQNLTNAQIEKIGTYLNSKY